MIFMKVLKQKNFYKNLCNNKTKQIKQVKN